MGRKLLLIEDNNLVRQTTAVILELANYDVMTARNGKEGVEVALKEKPDLIICDIMMPVLDGYGVLHLLSKNEETAGIPFIFLTARAEQLDFRKGMDMGADDYLTKPFDEIALLNAIETRLKKGDAMRKEISQSLMKMNEVLDEAREFNDLQNLSKVTDLRNHRKKDFIYHEGTMPRGIFFVSKGNVKTFLTNEQGKELITGLYKEGDFFGYHALFEESNYQESAMTLGDAEIGVVSKEDFFELVYRNQKISKKFIHLMSNSLREKEEQLIKLAYNSVRKRVAEALMKLFTYFNSHADGLTISRDDLANLAGTATETTIRTLSDFRNEGLIEIKGGSIRILNAMLLSRIKN